MEHFVGDDAIAEKFPVEMDRSEQRHVLGVFLPAIALVVHEFRIVWGPIGFAGCFLFTTFPAIIVHRQFIRPDGDGEELRGGFGIHENIKHDIFIHEIVIIPERFDELGLLNI